MSGYVVDANEIGIWCEVFGKPRNPAIMLIMGSGGQSILWRTNFCEKLAKEGFFVIRFDNRDTGRSASFDYAIRPYSLIDMAEDAIGVLDALSIKKAHFLGLSMGGYIAQLIAIYFPERVRSLISMSSTIDSSNLRGYNNPGSLPEQDMSAIDKIKKIYATRKKTQLEKIDAITEIWRVFNGTEADFPYEEWYRLAEESYKRARTHNAMRNHRQAAHASAPSRVDELSKLDVPSLIVHGSVDPIIKVEHAKYAAKIIPSAKLEIIKGMGHLATSMFDDRLIEIIVNRCKK
jgi:pimeloyl-ACP methyl ester carboxylesterase